MPLKKSIKDRGLIFYDQVGAGRSSELSPRHQTLKTLVADLEHLVDRLKIERFHLLGTSWGGSLALEYYFRTRGKGVASLILQSPLVSTSSWAKDADRLLRTLTPEHQKIIRNCLEVGATDSKVYQEAEKAYYKRYVYRGKPDPVKERYQKRFPNLHGKELYMNMWGPSEFRATGSLKSFDREKDLGKIKVPTLFIAGQYDEATPKTLAKFAKKVPDGRLEVIKNASHAILSEKPQAMARIVSKFVTSVDQAHLKFEK